MGVNVKCVCLLQTAILALTVKLSYSKTHISDLQKETATPESPQRRGLVWYLPNSSKARASRGLDKSTVGTSRNQDQN